MKQNENSWDSWDDNMIEVFYYICEILKKGFWLIKILSLSVCRKN